jgi:putative ABC transport system permease protein
VNWLALKMLTGDPNKYFGLISGICLATFLISQQLSLFIGVIRRASSQIEDVGADVWVMRQQTRQVDEASGLPHGVLLQVRGVPGVKWAVPLYRGPAWVRLEVGGFRNVTLLGVDDASLMGSPTEMVVGQLTDLQRPDAVIVDRAGYQYMWPGEPYRLGRTLELNDHRAVLVGICKVSPPYVSQPVLYTRHSLASQYVPRGRDLMPYVLVKKEDHLSAEEVCRRIEQRTGQLALTEEQFFWKTIHFMLGSTGVALNFTITVALGFLIGAAISGQFFYLFVVENLHQFGTLKAMGVTNRRIVGMILLQGAVVGAIGFGLGMGLSALFFTYSAQKVHLAGLRLYWQAVAATAAAVALIVGAVGLFAARRVLVLEPAIVFRG